MTEIAVGDRVRNLNRPELGEGVVLRADPSPGPAEIKWAIPDPLTRERVMQHDARVLKRIPTGNETEEPGRPVVCQNCEWAGGENECDEMRDVWSRVEPGDVMPAGDCPKCGAAAMLQVETAVAALADDPWTKTTDELPDETESVLGRWIKDREHNVVMLNLNGEDEPPTWCMFVSKNERGIVVDPPDYWMRLTVPKAEFEPAVDDAAASEKAASA